MIRPTLPDILPVELWNLEVQGRPLQAWRHADAFPERLADMLAQIRGRPPGHWPAVAREAARDIRNVYLCGGGAGPTLAAAISATGLGCFVAGEPRFAPALAGLSLGDACADIGQTSVKLVQGTWRLCVDRDVIRAPLRDEVPANKCAAARSGTIRFLAAALTELKLPGRLVIGLPCEVSPDGVPSSCSYCWPAGDMHLFHELSQAAGFSVDQLCVVNDAELAALAACRSGRRPVGGTVLALTIGFGIGGAIVTREATS